MKIALMQPYFFPYLGYLQLILAVDHFVVYDDVQYMKGGWVNRNRILMQGEPAWISLPVTPDAISSYINQRSLSARDTEKFKAKILGQLHAAYRKAPFYAETRELVESILLYHDMNLAKFLFKSLERLCEHLEIKTPLLLSSGLEKSDAGLLGVDRVIAICKALRATTYVNSSGGRALYTADMFSPHQIELQFLEMVPIKYTQGENDFVSHLSIIDVLMFNGREATRELLQQYTLQP